MNPTPPIVLGVGNPLAGDDGIGPAVVDRLRRERLPDGVELVDAGTSAFVALEILSSGREVILVDAVRLASEAQGTVVEFDFDSAAIARSAPSFSLHEVDMSGVLSLAAALGRSLSRVHVVGFVADPAVRRGGLSPRAAAAVEEIAGRVLREVANRCAGAAAAGSHVGARPA